MGLLRHTVVFFRISSVQYLYSRTVYMISKCNLSSGVLSFRGIFLTPVMTLTQLLKVNESDINVHTRTEFLNHTF